MICNQAEPMILQVAIFHYARCGGVGIRHAAFLRERGASLLFLSSHALLASLGMQLRIYDAQHGQREQQL